MYKQVKTYYTAASPLAKVAAWLLVAAAVYFVGKKIYKKFLEPPGADETVVVNANNLTYPVSDYTIYADQVEHAMFDLGTDEDTIFNVLDAMHTGDDVRQLIKSFGQREYVSFGIPLWTGNLIKWLTEELSANELQQVRDRFNLLGVAF